MPGFAKRLNALSRLILPEALTLLDLQALSALPRRHSATPSVTRFSASAPGKSWN
ncbi:hypothetical protein LOE28_23070 (plasmid) [Pseudosulfitobacter pseudonitzschiae]|nr:hypothetical protein [Pseudosulfitobacter pseudonitzschiae]UFE64170.1 hypothetical protein LOE28_23070 [Pseudosulfitobacter pseudonitzschiae]